MDEKTALLVVDMQRALLADGPFEGDAVVSRIARLIAACRERGVEVLFVRHDDGPGTALAQGTPGWALAEALSPAPGERVFDKRFNSAFYQTGLEDYLRGRGIGRLILVGMQTEYCMDATCKAAFEHGFSVTIPDGCFTTFDNDWLSAPALNAFYAHIWQGRFARLSPLEAVLLSL